MSRASKRYGVQPKTSAKVEHAAGKGLRKPNSISDKQIQTLAASVEAHIEPRKKPIGGMKAHKR
ncbi:MAG: hypothetical protein GC190_20190 [Alphaproteobacteria bacterium]|nr:hypothetical protein [Alphaproteobacteria bacterium]